MYKTSLYKVETVATITSGHKFVLIKTSSKIPSVFRGFRYAIDRKMNNSKVGFPLFDYSLYVHNCFLADGTYLVKTQWITENHVIACLEDFMGNMGDIDGDHVNNAFSGFIKSIAADTIAAKPMSCIDALKRRNVTTVCKVY